MVVRLRVIEVEDDRADILLRARGADVFDQRRDLLLRSESRDRFKFSFEGRFVTFNPQRGRLGEVAIDGKLMQRRRRLKRERRQTANASPLRTRDFPAPNVASRSMLMAAP